MKITSTLYFFICLPCSFSYMHASQNPGDGAYAYKMQWMEGTLLIAYRVAAVDFFEKKHIEECTDLEAAYRVQFTEITSQPSCVAITFYKIDDLEKDKVSVGGGQMTYVVDFMKKAIVKRYANK